MCLVRQTRTGTSPCDVAPTRTCLPHSKSSPPPSLFGDAKHAVHLAGRLGDGPMDQKPLTRLLKVRSHPGISACVSFDSIKLRNSLRSAGVLLYLIVCDAPHERHLHFCLPVLIWQYFFIFARRPCIGPFSCPPLPREEFNGSIFHQLPARTALGQTHFLSYKPVFHVKHHEYGRGTIHCLYL